jgi:hypothetical protein
MRWVAGFTIALLVASIQCLSACTLASCAQAAADSFARSAPPCHQHHKAPASQASHPCDHQQAVRSAASDGTPDLWAVAPVEMVLPTMAAAAPMVFIPHASVESPPGLLKLSVLRI